MILFRKIRNYFCPKKKSRNAFVQELTTVFNKINHQLGDIRMKQDQLAAQLNDQAAQLENLYLGFHKATTDISSVIKEQANTIDTLNLQVSENLGFVSPEVEAALNRVVHANANFIEASNALSSLHAQY